MATPSLLLLLFLLLVPKSVWFTNILLLKASSQLVASSPWLVSSATGVVPLPNAQNGRTNEIYIIMSGGLGEVD